MHMNCNNQLSLERGVIHMIYMSHNKTLLHNSRSATGINSCEQLILAVLLDSNYERDSF